MGEAGTPRGQLSAGAQVSAGRAPRWGDWPSLLSLWGDGSSPSSASWHRRQRAAFPPGARARLRASSSGTASQLPGARSRWGGGRAGDAGWGRACELRRSATDRPLAGELGLPRGVRGEAVAFPGYQPLGLSWELASPGGPLPGWVPPPTFHSWCVRSPGGGT